MESKRARRGQNGVFLIGGLLIGLGIGTACFLGSPRPTEPAPQTPAADSGGRDSPAGEESDMPTGDPSVRSIPAAPVVGAPAPDFALTDVDGKEIRLSDFLGNVVVVNFWATWCEPCRLEMPSLQEAYEALRIAGLQVLAVNFDEPVRDVCAFRDELGLSFPVLLDPGAQVQDLYRVRGYPMTFFIDRHGVVQATHIGILHQSDLVDYLKPLGIAWQ